MAMPSEQLVSTLASDNEQQEESKQFLTFLLGGEIYGVDILKVQEIKGWTPVTAIPNAPEYIKGVLNLRGEIVSIFDVRILFNLSKVEYNTTTVIIILTVNSADRERTIGLVVDAVWDVVNIVEEQMKPAPDFGENMSAHFISNLAIVEDNNLLLLDADRFISTTELSECTSPDSH